MGVSCHHPPQMKQESSRAIAVLALLELFILQDVLYVIFLARCVYPKKEVDDDPKGRESIHDDDFKIISFRKAAILFFCLKLMAL